MKAERNILIAFILNLCFSVFELVGGLITGSIAIISDAMHDAGDAATIGISYFLERKSKGEPDEIYTYGYARYSVMGGFITTLILLISSVLVIINAVHRMIAPMQINYDGMIVFAIVGACVNLCAAFFTREGGSLNQKAVNLHMLEDVLGWVVVLVGAIVMRITDLAILDPIMSVGVSLFILGNAIKNLKDIFDLFLEKAPREIGVAQIKEHLEEIDGVLDVHHIHLWSMDGQKAYATMHIVADCEPHEMKKKIREELCGLGIGHVTIELETKDEHCHEKHCRVECGVHTSCVHHHHH